MGHPLQAVNASHTSPSANKLDALTCHRAVRMQCSPSGSCRQWLSPVYPSDPPSPPGLVLDPTIICIYHLSRCMEGQGCRVALSTVTQFLYYGLFDSSRWRDAAPVVSPKSPSTSLCLVPQAGPGHAVSVSVLCSGAGSIAGPWSAGLGQGARGAGLAEGTLRADNSACASAEQSPEFLAGLAYTSYMIIACAAKPELKFPHMVLVDSFSSSFGEPFLPPVT